MDATCNRISLGKWMNCGQICVAPDYVLVHESRAKEFVERQKALVEKGFGADPKASAEYGNIIDQRHCDRLKELIETSQGEIICGGAQGIDREARHVPPTIIYKPSMDSKIMKEEIFGPVMPVVPYKNLDDALRIVKGYDTPLALYMYSQNRNNVEKVLSSATSGGSCVNSSIEHLLDEEAPFGGKGPSGMGAYHGKFGFDEFSHHRTILHKSTLPFARGAAFPLPNNAKPTPDFIYDIAAKLQLGLLPRPLKRALRQRPVKWSLRAALLSMLVAAMAKQGVLPSKL
eukprot:SRR837773.8032.p2 GENE.SRR837773.8032~~SRR837773.8032.p2  ORF type:complete len:295 (+),score=141.01 SRR837773.8032:25-885(+)